MSLYTREVFRSKKPPISCPPSCLPSLLILCTQIKASTPFYCSLQPAHTLPYTLAWLPGGPFNSTSDIVRSHEDFIKALRLVPSIVTSLWNLTGASAALLPMHLSSFKVIQQFKLQISGFQTSWDLTIRHLIWIWKQALGTSLNQETFCPFTTSLGYQTLRAGMVYNFQTTL